MIHFNNLVPRLFDILKQLGPATICLHESLLYRRRHDVDLSKNVSVFHGIRGILFEGDQLQGPRSPSRTGTSP
jgi:hypothetical protein